MVNVSEGAAQHIRKAIIEAVEQLREIERRKEADRPHDFDAHDRAVLEDMIPEFSGSREINPSSASFRFATATLYSYVAHHRGELTVAEFDELYRIYQQMKGPHVAGFGSKA